MIGGEERKLFESSVGAAVGRHQGQALDRAIEELGWGDAMSEAPAVAIPALFEALGRHHSRCSALSAVMAAGLGLPLPAGPPLLLPPVGGADPPGTLAGDRLAVHGYGLAPGPGSGTVAVASSGDNGRTVAVVEVALSALQLRPVAGIDPDFGLIEISGVLYAGAGDAGPLASFGADSWGEAVRLGRLAVAHELLGASRAMLELARTHALDRIQFGQPIARFQAVRHRLAETLVAVEGADALTRSAWDDTDPVVADLAKAVAGRAARTAARHCQQVLAGIGFTAEHPFHLYLRRVLLLDQMFGTSRRLTEEIGRRVLDARRLPPILAL